MQYTGYIYRVYRVYTGYIIPGIYANGTLYRVYRVWNGKRIGNDLSIQYTGIMGKGYYCPGSNTLGPGPGELTHI